MPKKPRQKQIGGQSDRQRPAPWLQTKGCTQWRKMVPHVEHNWWAGIYCPTGDIDGYLVFCPGFTRGSCRPEALR